MTKNVIRPPEPEIIQAAIRSITNGYDHFSCTALRRAANRYGCTIGEQNRYADQYRLWVNRGKLVYPYWWNSSGKYKAERTAALQSFLEGCVEAAEPPASKLKQRTNKQLLKAALKFVKYNYGPALCAWQLEEEAEVNQLRKEIKQALKKKD